MVKIKIIVLKTIHWLKQISAQEIASKWICKKSKSTHKQHKIKLLQSL